VVLLGPGDRRLGLVDLQAQAPSMNPSVSSPRGRVSCNTTKTAFSPSVVFARRARSPQCWPARERRRSRSPPQAVPDARSPRQSRLLASRNSKAPIVKCRARWSDCPATDSIEPGRRRWRQWARVRSKYRAAPFGAARVRRGPSLRDRAGTARRARPVAAAARVPGSRARKGAHQAR
jgi:hypothetical protein